jgi:polyphenol oxidase
MSIHLLEVPLTEDARGCFTGRDLEHEPVPVGQPGNLSHRRPHRPGDLARSRAEVGRALGWSPEGWQWMHQVHGGRVAEVTADTPRGAELRGVDALATFEVDRPLIVQVADCVPVLLAGPGGVAVAHAGRAGVHRRVVSHAVERLARGGQPTEGVTAVVGPAIGGCCYEVPEGLRDEVAEVNPTAAATTRWGTPALDLPSAVERELTDAGVGDVRRVGGCTMEDERFFSHRRDPAAGRQIGFVVRTDAA